MSFTSRREEKLGLGVGGLIQILIASKNQCWYWYFIDTNKTDTFFGGGGASQFRIYGGGGVLVVCLKQNLPQICAMKNV